MVSRHFAKSDSSGTISPFLWMIEQEINHSGALTDYQKLLTIEWRPEMQASFDDVRFNSIDGDYISYFIESHTDSDTADIWIKYDGLDGDTVVEMFYGNDGLSSESSGTDVFILFDDFNDASIDSALWDTVGTPVESGGVITCNASPHERMVSKDTFGINTKLRFRGYVANDAGTPWFGYRSGTATPTIEFLSSIYAANLIHGRGYESSSAFATTISASHGAWHTFEIKRTTNSATFSIDGDSQTITSQITENALPIEIVAYDSNEIKWDWVFVGQYAVTEPTVTYGEPQHKRTSSILIS